MFIDPLLRQTITGLIEDIELKRNKERASDVQHDRETFLIRSDISRVLEILYDNCDEDEYVILDSILINGIKNLVFTCNIPEFQFKENPPEKNFSDTLLRLSKKSQEVT